MSDVGERVLAAVVGLVHLSYFKPHADCRLTADLRFDSLNFEELSLDLEQEFNIRITPEDQSKWVTVKDVIDMVGRKLAPEEIDTAKREAGR